MTFDTGPHTVYILLSSSQGTSVRREGEDRDEAKSITRGKGARSEASR